MTPIDGIYVLDLKTTFNQEPMHNIFTYDSGDSGTSTDLINAFQADVLPAIQAIMCTQILFPSIKAYSLGNLGDFHEETFALTGARVGQMLPVFNALNYTLHPSSRAIRPGSKRFSGIPEDEQADGIIVDPPYIVLMETLRVALEQGISTDDLQFYIPVVVKRVKYVPDPLRPTHFAYRFPTTDAELVFAPAQGVTTTPVVTHQTSRGN